MRTSFRIAMRFLRVALGQTFLIALGIAIGIAVQLFIGALITGLQADLVNSAIGNSSHITVTSDSDDKLIKDYDAVRATLADERIETVSPVLDIPGLVVEDESSVSVLLRGMEMENADGIYDIDERMTEGSRPGSEDEAALGRDLAEELGLGVGDTLTVTVLGNREEEFTVSGIFDFKVAQINGSWMLADLARIQGIIDEEAVSAIEMQVTDASRFEADVIGAELVTLLNNDFAGDELAVSDWKAANEQLLSGINGQSVSSYMIQLFVLISVVLAIASVLAITVLQKSRQIGILKAMGMKTRQSSLVFFFQGFALGILGGILGVALGAGLLWSFEKFAVNADGTPVVDITLRAQDLLLSFGIAVVSASVASLIPARRSARMDPIDVIRNS